MVCHVFQKWKIFIFHFCQNFRVHEKWNLAFTVHVQKWLIFAKLCFGSFWRFGENREKDVKLRPFRGSQPRKPRISKIGPKTVFLVSFTLTHEQKFTPKFGKFDKIADFGRAIGVEFTIPKSDYLSKTAKMRNLPDTWRPREFLFSAKIRKPAYFTKEVPPPPKITNFYASKCKKKLPRNGENFRLSRPRYKEKSRFSLF